MLFCVKFPWTWKFKNSVETHFWSNFSKPDHNHCWMDWCLLWVLYSKILTQIIRCNMVTNLFPSSSTQLCSKWSKWKVSLAGVIISEHVPMHTEAEITSRWATTCWQIISDWQKPECYWSDPFIRRFQGPAASFVEIDRDINIHKWQTSTSMNLLVVISYYILL